MYSMEADRVWFRPSSFTSLDDSNDRAHTVREEIQRQLLADRVFVWPELLGHRLADQHGSRAIGDVGVIEIAPAHQRDRASPPYNPG